MNWIAALNSHLPALLLDVAAVTVILIAGVIAQYSAFRSTATRHAVLLGTLLAVAALPFVTAAAHLAKVPSPPIVGKSAHALNTLFAGPLFADPGTSQPIMTGVRSPKASIPGIVAAVWLSGMLWCAVRIIFGLWAGFRKTRAAIPVAASCIPEALTQSGARLPQILVLDQVAVPMAVGYFRPVIVMPSTLLASLSSQQLSQVLVHEMAHVRRHDALVALFQETLKAVFWFHPLVHFLSRRLDEVREEICDNYVLQSVPAREYAETLLTIAELIPQPVSSWFAPALIQSGKLEKRVAGLLHSRRCIMIHLTPKKIAAITLCFLSGVTILSSLAGAPVAAQDSSQGFSHVVRLVPMTSTPDRITIEEVRGPVDTIAPGNTYEVRGTYKLVTQDKAMLAAYVTTSSNNPHTPHPDIPNQRMIVEKGEGKFVLRFHMWHEGNPHVTFYPANGGNAWLSTYF